MPGRELSHRLGPIPLGTVQLPLHFVRPLGPMWVRGTQHGCLVGPEQHVPGKAVRVFHDAFGHLVACICLKPTFVALTGRGCPLEFEAFYMM